jgi:hypothetical protein
MDLAEQLAYHSFKAEQAYERALQFMVENRPEIVALSRRRLRAGYPLFRDDGWKKPEGVLAEDMLEEAADMLNYELMRMRGG